MYPLEKKSSLAKAGEVVDTDNGNVLNLNASNITTGLEEGSVVIEERRLLRKIDLW